MGSSGSGGRLFALLCLVAANYLVLFHACFDRARYLNPQSGRFWTMDTFEGQQFDPPSLHKYLYVHADPVNKADPSGNLELLPAVLMVVALARSSLLSGTT